MPSSFRDYFETKAGARKDYAVAYEDWLQVGESLALSTWEPPQGITVSGDEINVTNLELVVDEQGTTRTFPPGTVALVWLEVEDTASVGDEFDVINVIETDSSPIARKDKRTVRLRVVQQYELS